MSFAGWSQDSSRPASTPWSHGQPAFILYVQTFGDLVTFNPHIHALVADGVFLPSGTFRVLPQGETLSLTYHPVPDIA